MSKKVFSIITPTYNVENKLERTIKSVLNQKNDLFEYIIIDSNSEDNTLNIIKKYKNLLLWISEEDEGVYFAFNKGIDISKGKYLYFLGAGDVLINGTLEIVNKTIDKTNADIIYGDVFYNSKNYSKNKIYNGKYNKCKIMFSNICQQSIFYRKSIFEKYGKFDTKYSVLADYAFNIMCFGKNSLKKEYINYVIATYEGFGLSSRKKDKVFLNDLTGIIKENLGYQYFFVYNFRRQIVFFLKKVKLYYFVKHFIKMLNKLIH